MGGRTTEEDRADPDLDGYLDGEGPDVSGLSAGAVNSAGNPFRACGDRRRGR
jgi:hypothetical protein